MLLKEMEGGDSQEVADAPANRACETLSLTAMRPATTPEGGLDLTNVRAPDGVWGPEKDISAAALPFREE